MADIRVLKIVDDRHTEHSTSADSVQFQSFKTANYELTDTKLGRLVDGSDAADEHIHDARYFRENEHIAVRDNIGGLGVPVKTDATTGYLDNSFINPNLAEELDHGALEGLGDDDHTQYTRADGTRAFTGNQSVGGNKITNLGAPADAGDAANKAYVDAIAAGLRPKGNVKVATTANITLSGLQTIDTYAVQAGDRVLVKNQTDETENGIYVASAGAWTRSDDQDNSPLHEVVNGVFIPRVENGTQADRGFYISSVGTGTEGSHILGTDDIIWDIFTSPTQLQSGQGINFIENVVSVALAAGGGLEFDMDSDLQVNPSDFAGEGLVESGGDLVIDWSTAFNDSKAVKASDLSSTSNGLGASIIGVEDANGYFTADNQEGVNDELYSLIQDGGSPTYLAGVGGITKGQLFYISANNTALPYTSLTSNARVVGMALETVLEGASFKGSRIDKLVTAILTGATAGAVYYWSASGPTTTKPVGAGENVYLIGTAKNATDLSLEIILLYKNP